MTDTPVLYAPNVHIGGGLVLLQDLLTAWPQNTPLLAFLDERLRGSIAIEKSVRVHWVSPKVVARFAAQRRLRLAMKQRTTVLCFNGLPPLLPVAGRVVVFQQNRLHLTSRRLSNYGVKVAVRLTFERVVGYLLRHRVNLYVVQTPSMAQALMRWYGPSTPPPSVAILPFAHQETEQTEWAPADDQMAAAIVYVADGLPHKNHRNLFEAWRLLAEQGISPRLALTLAPSDHALLDSIAALRQSAGVDIVNLGRLPHAKILALYRRARALIFPSTAESFGLPLIEARGAELPIIASELDFVRDVCEPVQTFDPESPISIARAVRRFLGAESNLTEPLAPAAFWAQILAAPESMSAELSIK